MSLLTATVIWVSAFDLESSDEKLITALSLLNPGRNFNFITFDFIKMLNARRIQN